MIVAARQFGYQERMTRIALGSLLLVALVGCEKKPAPAPAPTVAPFVSQGGEIGIVADDKGFSPSAIQVPKGKATRLVFKRTSDKTCATEVVFPELSIKKPLPLGENVPIDLPVGESRTLAFQCGMGMYKSSVVVQ